MEQTIDRTQTIEFLQCYYSNSSQYPVASRYYGGKLHDRILDNIAVEKSGKNLLDDDMIVGVAANGERVYFTRAYTNTNNLTWTSNNIVYLVLPFETIKNAATKRKLPNES